MKKQLLTCLLFSVVLSGCNSDGESTDKSATHNADAIFLETQELAKQLSSNYTAIEDSLKSGISEDQLSISLTELNNKEPEAEFTKAMQSADLEIRSLKGVNDYADELMQVRLADKSMLQEWKDGETPLFAFEPKGDDEAWQYVEAYDIHGQIHQLDVNKLPDVPVLVIDTDSSKELKAGLQVMQKEMGSMGLAAQLLSYEDTPLASMSSDSSSEISTTAIKKIRLADDEEPWISGKAEIYAIVTGVDPSRDKPTIDLVEMPYLDYDNQDYYPNQIIVHWSRYRWGAADIVLMEQDSGTDYKELASLLVKVAEEVLKKIPDPEVQSYAIIPQITGQIIKAIPDGLLVNDDDYVDVYYTLMQDTSYVDHPAAGGNAVTTFEPLNIPTTRQ